MITITGLPPAGGCTTFNNIIKKILKKNGKNFKIILTGGYSYFFKNYLLKGSKIEKDITMHGIIKVYKNFLL